MSTKRFLGINFWSGTTRELLRSADRDGGLFAVPSAPSLAQTRHDPVLMRAYRGSDWAVIDGGYVALLLRFCFGRHLPRISGLQILEHLVGEANERAIPFHERRILWVLPDGEEHERVDRYLKKMGFPAEGRHSYLAPIYQTDADFRDEVLAGRVGELKPDWIVLCIGGGKQEKLGTFLRKMTVTPPANEEQPGGPQPERPHARPNGPVILCSGGAISFLSGGQISIPSWVDRMYLGWFMRVCQSPTTFLPRYWVAAYEFPRLLWDQRGKLFEKAEPPRQRRTS